MPFSSRAPPDQIRTLASWLVEETVPPVADAATLMEVKEAALAPGAREGLLRAPEDRDCDPAIADGCVRQLAQEEAGVSRAPDAPRQSARLRMCIPCCLHTVFLLFCFVLFCFVFNNNTRRPQKMFLRMAA